jgi:hypothetical protein
MAMGPGKVVGYLLQGLDKLNTSYKLNQVSESNLFLQNHRSLYEIPNIPNLVMGPNVFDLPTDNVKAMSYNSYKTLIVASQWVKDIYVKWLPENKVTVWNVGINYDLWNENKLNIKHDFLVYYKRRDRADLDKVLSFLKVKNLTYTIIEYGKYSEGDLLNAVATSKYGLLINNTETQGIAVQEMMSCNLPLLVWDVKEWTDRGEDNKAPATSVPYFDSTCGEIFYNIEDIEVTYNKFISRAYKPREYILKNCNYIIQAQKLVDILNN